MAINWLLEIRDLFAREKCRTLIRIEGNRLNCLHLDSRGKAVHNYKVKFKNSTKLKKFWEKYVLNTTLRFEPKERLWWDTRILNIRR